MNKFLKFFTIAVIVCGSALGIAAFVMAMKSVRNHTESYQIIRENLDEGETPADKTDDKTVFKCEWGGAKGDPSGASHKSCTEGEIPYGAACPFLPKDAPWKCTADGCIQASADDPDAKYKTQEECQAKGACGRYECDREEGCVWRPGTSEECKPTAEGNTARCSENPKPEEKCSKCFGFKCNISSPGQCVEYTGPDGGNPLEYACLEDAAACADKFGWQSKSQCEAKGAADGGSCRPYGCVGHPQFSLKNSPDQSSDEEKSAAVAKAKTYDNICGLVPDGDEWLDINPVRKDELVKQGLIFKSEADCKNLENGSQCIGYGCTGTA